MKKFYLASFFTMSAILLIATSGLTQTRKKAFTINFGLLEEGYGYPNSLPETQTNILPTANLFRLKELCSAIVITMNF